VNVCVFAGFVLVNTRQEVSHVGEEINLAPVVQFLQGVTKTVATHAGVRGRDLTVSRLTFSGNLALREAELGTVKPRKKIVPEVSDVARVHVTINVAVVPVPGFHPVVGKRLHSESEPSVVCDVVAGGVRVLIHPVVAPVFGFDDIVSHLLEERGVVVQLGSSQRFAGLLGSVVDLVLPTHADGTITTVIGFVVIVVVHVGNLLHRLGVRVRPRGRDVPIH